MFQIKKTLMRQKLSLLLFAALLPIAAWADTYTQNGVNYEYDESSGTASVSQSSDASGNITILSSFTVSGKDYSVTSIGNYAFQNCSSLTSVTIPYSVTSIGYYAFYYCSGLTSIYVDNGNTVYDSRNNCNAIIKSETNELIAGCKKTVIPNTVTSIGYQAFSGCSGLTSITIPNSVTSIGNYAFVGSGLTSVTIPNSVTSIGQDAFESCSGLTSVSIGNSVTSIGNNAFQYCSGLTSITIPNSVTSIGNSAFSGCSGLTSLTIPNSVTSIGSKAFNNTAWYNNQSNGLIYAGKVAYTYKGTMPSNTNISLREGTLGIANAAFSYRSTLTSVIIPNTVTTIGSQAFESCSGLQNVTIPNSVTSIGNYAFRNCSGLTSVVSEIDIPFSFGNNAFGNIASTCTLTVPAGTKAAYIAKGWTESVFKGGIIEGSNGSSPNITFADAAVKTICVANWDTNGDGELSEAEAAAVTNLGTVFRNNASIKSFDELQYFTGLTAIGNYAFQSCTGLTSITIPNSVTTIGYQAFYNCSNLSVTIPNSVTSIGSSAFYNCSHLASVPNFVMSVGIDAFDGTAWFTNQPVGLVYAGKVAYKYKGSMPSNTSISLQEGTSEITARAFWYCSNLTSVTIPNSVTNIGYDAFYNCSGLTSVAIPNSVTGIGGSAFYGCSGLTSVTFGNSVTSISNSAFYGCSRLTNVTIPNSVTSIEYQAFSNCSGLTSVTIPNSVTSIGGNAFARCSSLSSVVSEIETPFSCDAFYAIADNCTLTVPAGTKAAYIEAGWTESVFKGGIIEIDNRIEQTLEQTSLPTMTYGDAVYTLPAITAQGQALTWTSNNTSVATIANDKLNIVGVGSATITATQAGNDDYAPFSKEFNLTVNKAMLTITADDKTKVEGEENPELTVSYSGFKNGEDKTVLTTQPTVTTTATTNSPVGTYPITASGAEAQNYDFTYVNGTLTVTEASAQPTVDVTDTDLSKLANTIYLERVEATPGGQLTLSVKMKNVVMVESFGFDLYLPDGVTVATDEDGFPLASLSTQRTTANKTNNFNADFKEDGALNIQAFSTRGYTISGNDGEVALITINIAGDVEAGEYPIIIRNIAIADENSVTYRVDYVKSTLAISSYTLGDANSDNFIDVGDLTAISHYILERPDASFNAKAADANIDNNIDVGDLTAVSHIILWGSVQRPSGARLIRDEFSSPMQLSSNVTDISDLDNVIYVEPFTVAANSTFTMSVKMKNAVVAEGFGFDLVLPEGITVATDGDGFPLATLSSARTTANKTNNFNADFKLDGTLNVQAWSSNGSSISGNDGEVAQIVLNIAANVNPDTYPIYIRNIAISDVNATSHRTDEVETAVTVTAAEDYDVLLNEMATTDIEPATNVKVKVLRTINADEWSTICLPFAMTATQIQDAFGADVQIEEFKGWKVTEYDNDDNATAIEVTFASVSAIEANTPYVIKVSKAISEFTVNGVDIDAEDEPAVIVGKINKGTFGSFTGSYVPTIIDEECLFLSENKFWYSVGKTNMKGFRAYFYFQDVLADYNNEAGADARVQFSFGDGETTGVADINRETITNNGSFYNINGQRVEKPTKGLYITNGRKVVIK